MLDIAQEAVRLALAQGATDAECTISEGDEFDATVRMRQLETLKEAGSRGAGLRILLGQKVGSSYTSDLTRAGIEYMVRSALEIAQISTEDPYAGLPEAADLGSLGGDLGLYCEDVAGLETQFKIDQATVAEESALSADARISNSEGGSFSSYTGGRYFANSRGFAGSYRSSSCSLSVVAVAQENGSMERDYWYTLARGSAGLEKPEFVGLKAAERTLRRLGARKIATQKAPVIFEPRVARGLLSSIFEAIDGESVYRKSSFLAGKLGEKVASENVTVVDDGTIPGLFGTTPFDDEGVPSRRTVAIDRGVLQSYLLNTYTARKLGLKSTGNASRGITGNASVGPGNFFLEKGSRTPEEILRSVKRGLYVTELIGSGVNIVTGDYSRGAVGLWIENGELAYPVSEITIAANLREMLMDIEMIGSDLTFLGSTASPTILIREMTISGQ
jgi:PmbA protein